VGVIPKEEKYILLKNLEDLTPEEKVKLSGILRQSVCLRITYRINNL
jgi:hypothetical protein